MSEQISAKPPQKQTKPFRLGRPTKYKVGYCRKIIEFFTVELYTTRVKSRTTTKTGNVTEHLELLGNPPPWFGDFAYSIGTDQNTVCKWTKQHDDFRRAYARAKELQYAHINNLANIGVFNSQYAQFTMKNISDWRDKKDLELSGKVDAQLFFQSMLVAGQEALDNETKVLAGSRLN